MRALLKEKQEVAKGTLLVTFDLLGEEIDFKPGQYFHVTLPNLGDDDKRLRRHITVVTSPNERGVLGFATRMRDSAFKRTLRELPVGSEVEVESPKGKFTLPDDPSRPLVFVAGGTGITVSRGMLRAGRERRGSWTPMFVKDYFEADLDRYTFLVAGPPGMAEGAQGALREAGVRDENVITERYSGY